MKDPKVDSSSPERSHIRTRAAALALLGAAVAGGTAYGVAKLLERRQEQGAAPGGDPQLELPLDSKESYVASQDGGRIRVVEAGAGSTILLLHGAGLGAECWAYQFHDLSASRRLVALDQRGHGSSEPGSEGVTIAAMTDDVARVLEELDLRRVLLVGHSMGGMVALRLARRHPDLLRQRVQSLVLMSTTGGVTPNIAPWERLLPLASRAAVGLDARINRTGRFSYPGRKFGVQATRLGFGANAKLAHLEATARMLQRMQPARLVGLLPELVGFDERAPYTDLRMPVTVVVGDRDKLTPPAGSEFLASILPGARLVVMRHAGHMLMYERRSEVDRLLKEMSARPEDEEAA